MGYSSSSVRDNLSMGFQKMPPQVRIEIATEVNEQFRDVVVRGLRDFNARHLGEYEWTAFDVYARDMNGRVVGGLIGDVALGWLEIHGLWVTEDRRGAGLGTEILQAAENAAAKSGCRAVILDTLGFQAQAFYEKNGYIRIGTVDNYRGGVQKVFMQKRLQQS